MDWYQIKQALSAATGVSEDALHVFAGVAIQLLLVAALRKRVAHLLPWGIVLALAALNEWSDLQLDIWPNRADQWRETIKDLIVTMALPTVFLILSRWTPGLFVPRPSPAPKAPSPSDGA